ncbi:MAG: Translation initiation factor IF-2 [Candidatus Beckwithbacteria bacterium GW2011_GWA2_43_10]|uniref:Translation initiation factor IF-2 n=1 Tax=Candidatus Beckwithbacteria bacterium GW2011_GWA2_43_10 TaxID=1618369 RepID=A0A0G1C2P2_9BACT|nr:MAG: Translation initiation factor IF-2 [Candidatus Beckwithbacteria bacterium GW2011_GWA2_43_10]
MIKLTKKSKRLKRPKSSLVSRPPVITVMGHIDHGKTTLLDALRHTHVADKESGGITQHIGAYQLDYQGRKLTFIDTPGHAAFASMRSRGVQVTDLVVLVIDAVESVKPQTRECLDHIQAAQVPFLVAINKIDLPNASSAIVKKDLADAGVMVEGFGGDIVCVEISAKTGKNLDQLLEMILLLTDMSGLANKPLAPLQAIVIESFLDKKRGPVATIIVKQGTLKLGDELNLGQATGKVKALFNEKGEKIPAVFPGCPAQVLGFSTVPAVGAGTLSAVSATADADKDVKTLKIILKTDVAGTLEAITKNLSSEVTLISAAVGEIGEADVALAQSTKAKIIGFRVKATASAQKLAEIEAVLIKNYSLIHELLDDLQNQVLKMLEPTIDEEILGEARIIAQFTVKGESIAGCQVTSGKLMSGNLVHLLRNKEPLAHSKIKSIHQGKDVVEKAKKGEEYGIAFTAALSFQLKDTLQAYRKI